MKYIASILVLIVLIFTSSGLLPWFDNIQEAYGYSGIPTFMIESVVRDKSVTIKTINFPANDTFKVLMNKMGTKGIKGIQVDTISSGSGGSFRATFAIPEKLKGYYQISIRLESTTGSGYYAYNWFYNNTGKGTWKYYSIYDKKFSILITKVVKDKKVSFTIYNPPKKDSFKIIMYKYGKKPNSGERVGDFSTGDGRTRNFIIEIPASMKDINTLRIRLQSLTNSGLYIDSWFYNKTYP